MDFFGAHHILDPTRNLEEEGPLLNVNAAECLERLSGLAGSQPPGFRINVLAQCSHRLISCK